MPVLWKTINWKWYILRLLSCFTLVCARQPVYATHLYTRPLVLCHCVFVGEGERAPPTVKFMSIEAVGQEITAEWLPSYKTEAFYTADAAPLLVSSYFSASRVCLFILHFSLLFLNVAIELLPAVNKLLCYLHFWLKPQVRGIAFNRGPFSLHSSVLPVVLDKSICRKFLLV